MSKKKGKTRREVGDTAGACPECGAAAIMTVNAVCCVRRGCGWSTYDRNVYLWRYEDAQSHATGV